MFDWNEDEIADIIWGDDNATESGDHIVPYPKGAEETTLNTYGDSGKKQSSQGASTVIKSSGHKASDDKNDLLGSKLENNSCFNTDEELLATKFDLDSWPSNISGQESEGDSVPDDFPDVTDLDLVKDKGRLPADPGLFENDYENKDGGNFLDFGWANIGNFDDLDRIFRNNDSVLGNEIIGNADELWSASADLIASPMQSYPVVASSPTVKGFSVTSEEVEVRKEFKLSKCEPQVPDCDKVNEAAHSITKASDGKTEDSTETTASQSQVINDNSGICSDLGDKVNRERKLLKCRKKVEEKSNAMAHPNLYGAWSHASNQTQPTSHMKMHASSGSVPLTFPCSVTSMQHGQPESLRYMHATNPIIHTAYRYPANHFPTMPVLPLVHSERDQGQVVTAGYNYSTDSPKPSNPPKLPDVPSRSSSMTPQEKIEKLRRRQQMQAMLAIKEQQEQLRHQELNMPREEGDGSNNSTLNEEFILEETIFNQLQDVVGKLDIKTRLFIRDSLFRLARSAVQRQNICDTISTNKSSKDEDELLVSGETNSNDRSMCLMEAEADTNHIDRTVANLLFHRPMESCGRPSKDGMPESPITSNPRKLLLQPKMEDCLSPPTRCLSESGTDIQSSSDQECQPQLPCISTGIPYENQFHKNL